MRRLLVAAVCAIAASGCTSFRGGPSFSAIEGGLDPMDATPVTYDFSKNPFSSAGEAVLTVPETVVWWPYKIVSSTLRGGYDGVSGGMARAPMPIFGVITSPLTAAAGAVKGTFTGVGRGPAYIRSTKEFGHSLGRPWREPIPLWNDGR
jgi:hypothetical protein